MEIVLTSAGLCVSRTDNNAYTLSIPDRGASCQISSTIGAHLTSWKVNDHEMIFLSERADLTGRIPIRGGIPLCFPQFSKFGPYPQSHGFARNLTGAWRFERAYNEGVPQGFNDPCVVLVLSLTGPLDTPRVSTPYPHPFVLTMTFRLYATRIALSARVDNPSPEPLAFGFAYHPYFRVEEATQVGVRGLQGVRYKDQLVAGPEGEATQAGELLTVDREVDRIYRGAPERVVLEDLRTHAAFLAVERRNISDLVVWNPWVEKSKTMKDFQPEEYHKMICIEPAQVDLVQCAPGGSWEGQMVLSRL
ncbi:putative apospory-associated protein c [Paratrimastix pyriformis]|uniref:glucose-6-phosphate 1-epimerase n=1 Tax=Paratrimastix pyriformis TaxID=342808 RepID=A0ABQ8UCI7_9EUKA|nr:putative apospory-associated protein c [Paratrimastix pyriformis]